MTHLCPVCSYTMDHPPIDYAICPCCGTEFGYHTAGRTLEEIRREWIRAGAKWWSPTDVPPTDWNPIKQLLEAGLNVRIQPQSSPTSHARIDTSHGRSLAADFTICLG